MSISEISNRLAAVSNSFGIRFWSIPKYGLHISKFKRWRGAEGLELNVDGSLPRRRDLPTISFGERRVAAPLLIMDKSPAPPDVTLKSGC